MKKLFIIIALLVTVSANAKIKSKDYHYKNYVVPSFIIAKAHAEMYTSELACDVWHSFLLVTSGRACTYDKVYFVCIAQKYAGFSLEKKKKK